MDWSTSIMHGKVSPPPRSAKHLIADSHSNTTVETNDGLAFTIGVAAIECELTKDVERHYCIRHPNDVCIYHVMYAYSHVAVFPVDSTKPVTHPCTWPKGIL